MYLNFVAKDPEILAFGRNNVAPIRMMIEKPDLQAGARQLYDDVTAAITQGILPDVDATMLVAALSVSGPSSRLLRCQRRRLITSRAAHGATRPRITSPATTRPKTSHGFVPGVCAAVEPLPPAVRPGSARSPSCPLRWWRRIDWFALLPPCALGAVVGADWVGVPEEVLFARSV